MILQCLWYLIILTFLRAPHKNWCGFPTFSPLQNLYILKNLIYVWNTPFILKHSPLQKWNDPLYGKTSLFTFWNTNPSRLGQSRIKRCPICKGGVSIQKWGCFGLFHFCKRAAVTNEKGCIKRTGRGCFRHSPGQIEFKSIDTGTRNKAFCCILYTYYTVYIGNLLPLQQD